MMGRKLWEADILNKLLTYFESHKYQHCGIFTRVCVQRTFLYIFERESWHGLHTLEYIHKLLIVSSILKLSISFMNNVFVIRCKPQRKQTFHWICAYQNSIIPSLCTYYPYFVPYILITKITLPDPNQPYFYIHIQY